MRAIAQETDQEQAALAVTSVSYSYSKVKALRDVNLALTPGRVLMLLGPNGAGKTTLFSLITRLYDTQDGSICVFGNDLRDDPGAALAGMGVVFQQPTLDLDLTVMQNLTYHAALHGMASGEARVRALEELARLSMTERAGERVRDLNGGHRRRVEIARALMHRPRLLLLDEPTVGLDVPTRQALVAHVHALARKDGIAVFWATHLIDEVAANDRVAILHRGEIRAHGTVTAVQKKAGARSLLDAFNRLTRDATEDAA